MLRREVFATAAVPLLPRLHLGKKIRGILKALDELVIKLSKLGYKFFHLGAKKHIGCRGHKNTSFIIGSYTRTGLEVGFGPSTNCSLVLDKEWLSDEEVEKVHEIFSKKYNWPKREVI